MLRSGVLLCAFALAIDAQTSTGTLFGVVRYTSGGAGPGVTITATQVETSLSRKTLTDGSGEFLITNLSVGPYSLSVEKSGFRRVLQEGIRVEVNQKARVDVMLSVGQVSESIRVTADAIGVDTRSSTVGEVVDRVRVQELPLNGRNAMELARIVPGVSRTFGAHSHRAGTQRSGNHRRRRT